MNLKQKTTGTVNIPATTCSIQDLTSINGSNLTWTGYLKPFPGTSNSAFAFMFFAAQKATNISQVSQYPTILWLQGGPGASSMIGNFWEFGPLLPQYNDVGQVVWNKNIWTWNKEFNLLFIDNPIGTGFSYAETTSEIPTNEADVADQLYYGLSELYNAQGGCFRIIPNMNQSKFFIFGESYAGKYVPALGERILLSNNQSTFQLNLAGIGFGDGFTDPGHIMSQLAVWGFNMGMLDFQERGLIENYILQGELEIMNRQWIQAQIGFQSALSELMEFAGTQDVYNFRVDIEKDPINLNQLLTTRSVYVGLFNYNENITFQQENQDVYIALSNDFMQNDCVISLEQVINSSLPVLIYQGQNDIIVCTPCSEKWIDRMQYVSANVSSLVFLEAYFKYWQYKSVETGQNVVGGYYKKAGNFTFATFNNAGHMVPQDQPEAAYDYISNWIKSAL